MPANFTCPACGSTEHSDPTEPGDIRCADEHDIGCCWSGPWPTSFTVTIRPAGSGGFIAELGEHIGDGDTLFGCLINLAETIDQAIGPNDPRDTTAIEISRTQERLGESIVRLLRLETLDAPAEIMASELKLTQKRIGQLAELKKKSV